MFFKQPGNELDLFQIEPAAKVDAGEEKREVTIPFELLFPLVADASEGDRGWLKDFAQETISVSPDLYDVLQAYRHFHMEERMM